MADFQYLAPEVPDFLMEVKDADVLNQDVRLHIQPPVFTRFDRPADYNYRSEPQSKPGCKADRGDDLDEERFACHEASILLFSVVLDYGGESVLTITEKVFSFIVSTLALPFSHRRRW